MKWVYSFDEARQKIASSSYDSGLSLFGAKGTRLVEMTGLALPVPPGFIITTEVCRAYYDRGRKLPNGLWQQVLDALSVLRAKTGLAFGSRERPLLVSVRSGAKHSMPGMMDTIPNVGLTEDTLAALIRLTNDRQFAYDCYRRFLTMFARARSEFGPARQLEALAVRALTPPADSRITSAAQEPEWIASAYRDAISSDVGRSALDDPEEQLRAAIQAVFDSWNNDRAIKHRAEYGMSNLPETAATVQQMVFGNIGKDSGTGVVFSRDQLTGEKGLYGEYIQTAQGEDLVSGARTPFPIQKLQLLLPAIYQRLQDIVFQLERHYRAVQDVEFTVEHGKLWVLQSRNAKPSAAAAVKIAVQMVREGLLLKSQAVSRITPGELDLLSRPRFSQQARAQALKEGRLLTKGIPASSGAATGQVVFTADSAVKCWNQGGAAILVCQQVSPDDAHGIRRSIGVIANQGGASSHAALIARALNRVCVVGCADLNVDMAESMALANGRILREGEIVSVDGTSGEVILGEVESVVPEEFAELREFRQWYENRSPWANAVSPERAQTVDGLRTAVLDILQESSWVTEKAKVVELLGRMIPSEHAIRQVVVNAKDEEALRQAMLDAVRRGYWTGPRTCYHPDPKLGKARWQMAIQTEQEVESFIRDPEYRVGTSDQRKGSPGSGGYPAWVADVNLREIIVPFDPPKKGLPEFELEHLVFTVSYRSTPDRIEVEANLGTTQLRSLERANPSDLIHIVMLIEPDTPDLRGRRFFSFGRKYLKSETLRNVTSAVRIVLDQLGAASTRGDNQKRNATAQQLLNSKGRSLDHATRDICLRLLAMNSYPGVEQVDEQLAGTKISEAMRSSNWDIKLHEHIVKPEALNIARSIGRTVFETWWSSPFELPALMQALDEATNLNTLEAQGRFDARGSVDYMLIYGAKGVEERRARLVEVT